MDKEKNNELTAVNLRDYYHSLRKGDKGRLLRYLMDKFEMSYPTLLGKFAGRVDMSKSDIILINMAVKDESLWKQ